MCDHIGWKRRSGKKRFHSIRIPAVMVKNNAATTGAVDRNFFMGEFGQGESLNEGFIEEKSLLPCRTQPVFHREVHQWQRQARLKPS